MRENQYKQPYIVRAERTSMRRGKVVILEDRNKEEYLIGIGLTVDNANTGGPYGCRTVFDLEDAYTELTSMCD